MFMCFLGPRRTIEDQEVKGLLEEVLNEVHTELNGLTDLGQAVAPEVGIATINALTSKLHRTYSRCTLKLQASRPGAGSSEPVGPSGVVIVPIPTNAHFYMFCSNLRFFSFSYFLIDF